MASRRFRERIGELIERCATCKIRLNMPTPYCSRVCMDSMDASRRRDMERWERYGV